MTTATDTPQQAGPPTVFTVGEEVLHDGVRYVIGDIEPGPPERFRLLATTLQGARIVWAPRRAVAKLTPYTRPNDDTARL